MKPASTSLSLLLIAVFTAALHAADAGPPKDVLVGCPDPAVIEASDGSGYYVFSTGNGIPVFRSGDLFHWKKVGFVFNRDAPAWAKEAIPRSEGVWAPDVSWFNGLYHVYYAVSSFGSQRSVIGLAVNKTLNPSSPEYRWEDRGLVLDSAPGRTNFNAIDPALFVDRDKTPYLFWGSYWTGIKAAKIDPATGKPRKDDFTITPVAARAKGVEPPAIEAPFVIFRDGYYYLFVSWDFCCAREKSTYKVMVGRSKSVLGPYVDHQGRSMTEGGGALVLASYDRWRGPGHNSVLATPRGDWLVNAGYDTHGLRRGRVLQVRPIYWLDGWPVTGETLTAPATTTATDGTSASAVGNWLHRVDYSWQRSITLKPDGSVEALGSSATWKQDRNSLSIEVKDPRAPAGVWKDRLVLEPTGKSYVGRNQQGQVIFGVRGP